MFFSWWLSVIFWGYCTYFCPLYRLRSDIVPGIDCCCVAVVLLILSYSLWVHGVLVDVSFLLCAVCCTTTAALRTAVVVCSTGWLGGSLHGFVHGFVSYFFFYVLPPAIPAPRRHSSACHQ